MRRMFCIALTFFLSLHAARAAEERTPTPQVERGRGLFLKSPKGTACGTCHSMAGLGTAVGPDLKTLASVVGPRGLVSAIKMTVTACVQEVETTGAKFPGLVKEKRGEEIDIWDLSEKVPALRKFTSKQVVAMRSNRSWRHPPASAGYTSQELADLIGLLKWGATGSEAEVKAEDVANRR